MPKAFSTEDICHYQTVSHLDFSPNAAFAVCTVQSTDLDDDKTESAIWALPLDGGEPHQFSAGAGRDRAPRWSPDGSTIAFTSSRSGSPQIYLLSRDGGEARQLSHFASGASSAQWSPDGRYLLVICTLPVDPEKRGASGRDVDPCNERKDGPKLCWRLPYKLDGVGFTLDAESHLFKLDANTGEHVRLTHGAVDVRSAAWSPDSRRVAFVQTREGRLANRTDIWVMDADGTHARQLTDSVAVVQSPSWSPDGNYLVFSGSEDEG
ncbi:MAG TPA: LpqB family beta-propeller domain-containing protein, partial [Opitutus sp.]|nr:LpqB family beta-propeller domain-containing protein [Opitutus sp.]